MAYRERQDRIMKEDSRVIIENWLTQDGYEYECKYYKEKIIFKIGIFNYIYISNPVIRIDRKNCFILFNGQEELNDNDNDGYIFYYYGLLTMVKGSKFSHIYSLHDIPRNDSVSSLVTDYSKEFSEMSNGMLNYCIYNETESGNSLIGEADEWARRLESLGVKKVFICYKNNLSWLPDYIYVFKQRKIQIIPGIEIEISGGIYRIFSKTQSALTILIDIYTYIDRYTIEDIIGKEDIMIVSNATTPVTREDKNISYQIDFVEYLSIDTDEKVRKNLERTIEKFPNNIILMNDIKYLDATGYLSHRLLLKNLSSNLEYVSKDNYPKIVNTLIEKYKSYFKLDPIIATKFITKAKGLYNAIDFQLELPKINIEEDSDSKKSLAILTEKVEGKLNKLGMDNEKVYVDRISSELEVINKKNMAYYFLIAEDVCNYAREKEIIVGFGRGSSVGSLVCYLLGITKIDPIKYNLSFERFLNKYREGKKPDIDMDFQSSRRDEIINYLQSKYGEWNCIGISNSVKQPISKVLATILKNIGYDSIIIKKHLNNLLKMGITGNEGYILERILRSINKEETHPDIRTMIMDDHRILYHIKNIGNMVSKSTHASGIFISNISSKKSGKALVPAYKTENRYVSAWDSNTLEEIGVMKHDVLGMRVLDKMQKLIRMLEEQNLFSINEFYNNIPLDIKEVYDFFINTKNYGIFQFGEEVSKYVEAVSPSNFDELCHLLSLVRPGGMISGSLEKYIETINTGKKTTHGNNILDEILESTNGVIIYDDQLIEIMIRVYGFEERRSYEFIRSYDINKISMIEKFPDQKVFRIISDSKKYLYNKSHAVAYTILSYTQQYLKYRFPIHFLAILLEDINDRKSYDKYIEEAKSIIKDEVIVKSPDINESSRGWKAIHSAVSNSKIYYPLDRIKFRNSNTVDSILLDRKRNGRYTSLENLVDRLRRYKILYDEFYILIYTGCLDEIYDVKKKSNRMGIVSLLKKIDYDKNDQEVRIVEPEEKDMRDRKFFIEKQKQYINFYK